MAFRYRQVVRLYHTDAYGVIFFGSQLQFCHDAYQAFLDHIGFPLPRDREAAEQLTVIVRCESDYHAPVTLGERLDIEVHVEALGESSLTLGYQIMRDGEEVGSARTVHVAIGKDGSGKRPLPEDFRAALAPYLPSGAGGDA